MFELQLKKFLAQFFKTDVHLGKQPLSKTVPAIPQKMCGSYVTMDFTLLVRISKETKMQHWPLSRKVKT